MRLNHSMSKVIIIITSLLPALIYGSESSHVTHGLDGTMINIFWVIPFVGILLSIAVLPLIAPTFWHHHFGKVSMFWGLSFVLPFIWKFGFSLTLYELLHVGLLEYLPFIILLLSLFTISGGVRLTGSLVGTPQMNLILILVGTCFASWMGTTGAAMLLIRPLIRANSARKYKVHTIIFFIFLVANIGGSLSPLGDPPLFLGFLKGVDFFWTTKHMIKPMIFMVACISIIYYLIDVYFYKKETNLPQAPGVQKLGLEGQFNLVLLLGVILSVLMSGFWKPHNSLSLYEVHLELQNITRDILLIILTLISWKTTTKTLREANEFTWFPIVEVAKLFAGIFVTIIPAIAILRAGTHGALAKVIESVTNESGPINYMYFWFSGMLSSFLDNAPTYLVFFNTAGGDAMTLMTTYQQTLLAISTGAVFMGANTYIGNAPNFMVKSISEASGITMPSFFGYMFKYSIPILFPLYFLLTFLFFR